MKLKELLFVLGLAAISFLAIGFYYWLKPSEIEHSEEIPKVKNIISDESLSIEKMFDGMTPKDSEEIWTLAATGDVMLGRTVNYKTINYGDYTWAFKNIAEELMSADLAFINLENPMIENCPVKNDGMIFCSSTKHIEGILHAGVDVASIANNHTMNFGQGGLDDTQKVLHASNILTPGVNNPEIKVLNGMKIAFLAYNEIECLYGGIACMDEAQIKNDISTAKEFGSDLIIIMYHWGSEYTHQPTERQKHFAHLSIDNGADLVLGNHPHWYQPVEIYKDKVIMYSHGNLIFDQMWSEKTREGVIGKYFFQGTKLIDIEFIPIYIEDYGQPRILIDEHGRKVISNLSEISAKFN